MRCLIAQLVGNGTDKALAQRKAFVLGLAITRALPPWEAVLRRSYQLYGTYETPINKYSIGVSVTVHDVLASIAGVLHPDIHN